MKTLKHILIVVALFGVAGIASKLGDWATGRKPPSRPIPSDAMLAQGAPVVVKEEMAVTLDFDVLKRWTYVEEQHTPIPGYIQKYNGKMVEMTGYMMALGDIEKIQSFMLVPALFGCCYGQPPAVNHIVMVKMNNGATCKYSYDKICVHGQFHCGEEKQDGYLVSLYHIDADQVVTQ